MPDHTFSASWSEVQHARLFTDYSEKVAKEKGWRIMKYMIIVGEDFEFPNQSHLAHTAKGNIKVKP
jgi:hypothetical protein